MKSNSGDAASLRFNGRRYNQTESYDGRVDYLALYAPHFGVTAFLKPCEMCRYPTLRYDAPGDMPYPSPNTRYARDYPLERVIKECTQ